MEKVAEEGKGKEFVKKESNYSKKYHLRIVGSFEAAIIGQQKYDAVSSATGGGVNSNKNSNVKVILIKYSLIKLKRK